MQIEHKTEKGTLCFVKLADDVIKCKIENNGLFGLFEDDEDYYPIKDLTTGNWQIIGLTSEVTEEKAKMMGFLSLSQFRDVMQHLEVYEVNPYGEKEPERLEWNDCTDYHYANNMFAWKLKKWQQAQCRTGKWLILFKHN